jgi:hypothetical protein
VARRARTGKVRKRGVGHGSYHGKLLCDCFMGEAESGDWDLHQLNVLAEEVSGLNNMIEQSVAPEKRG